MNSDAISTPIVVAAIMGAVSVMTFAGNYWLNGYRERTNRQREVFSQAFIAIVAYEEYPFVIRRRRASGPEDERIRISTDLGKVQEKLSYYSVWLKTESKDVSLAYEVLVAEIRKLAGAHMREAWDAQPISDDSGMNMPDLGLGNLTPFKESYFQAVAAHLSAWPTWIAKRI